MMAAKSEANKNTVVSMFPANTEVTDVPAAETEPAPVVTPDAPKKARKPRVVRPAADRLAELKARYEAYKAVSEGKIKAIETKIAFLEAKAAKVASDEDVLAEVEGKTADDIEREMLEAARKLAVLKKARKLRGQSRSCEARST